MEQLNIEGKRSGSGFVADRLSLVGALSRAQADILEFRGLEYGRRGLANYLRLLGGGMVKIFPSGDGLAAPGRHVAVGIVAIGGGAHLGHGMGLGAIGLVILCSALKSIVS